MTVIVSREHAETLVSSGLRDHSLTRQPIPGSGHAVWEIDLGLEPQNSARLVVTRELSLCNLRQDVEDSELLCSFLEAHDHRAQGGLDEEQLARLK